MKALIDCYARIIYAIPFAIFGLMHFMKGGDMAGMVPSFIPGGIFLGLSGWRGAYCCCGGNYH